MNCYLLNRNFGCKTASGFHWSLERDLDGASYSPYDGGWHPREDTHYEQGENTWFASGKVTRDSKERMSKLWVRVVNAKNPMNNSHVIGDYSIAVKEEVIVDQAFVDTMTALDPDLFDFWRHDKIWDVANNCPPWDGPSYFATLLPMLETFDPETTEMFRSQKVKGKNQGMYTLGKHPPTVKASAIAGHFIWRDRLTRKVLCTQPFLDALFELGVPEWETKDVQVLDDRN